MSLKGQLLHNQSLADYTTWRVGGVAKSLYIPYDIEDLALFLKTIPADEPIVWLGLGSNCLIRDGGFKGTVILTQGALNGLSLTENGEVRVEAGVSCAKMARFCSRNGLVGGEFWAGIPGTMGGALRMNAGCFNGETWDHVIEVEMITREGDIKHRPKTDFQVQYRHVEWSQKSEKGSQEWFIAATCRLKPGDKVTSLALIKHLLEHRAQTQPTNEYNCGSVFRNPPHQFAAKLIESCGLKGMRVGGAMVSPKHANFIINDQGNAKASDIESLIEHVQKQVFEATQVQLLREVHIIGDDHDLT